MSHLEESVTAINVCWQLHRSGVSDEDIPARVGRHRATVYRWLKGLRKRGLRRFVAAYRKAKKGRRRRKTDAVTKRRILAIREKRRQCCGEKIRHFMMKEHGVAVSVPTIYRVLATKYQLRSKWKKSVKRGKPLMKAEKPREVVQVDTVDFGAVFAFTAIDIFTREAFVTLSPTLDSRAGALALARALDHFGQVAGIQRDGGPEFKGEWDELARRRVPRVRTAKPYRKNEQAFIERFNGILRKECLGYGPYRPEQIPELQKPLDEFMRYYCEERPHLSLKMKTPKEFAAMSHLT